jgi:hypothetical protein
MAAHRKAARLLAHSVGFGAVLASAAALPDEVVVLTSGAFTAPYRDAEPWFERSTQHELIGVFGSSAGDAPDSTGAPLAR